MHNNTFWCAVVGSLVMISACGEVDDGGFASDVAYRPYTCPTWRCGFNAAEVNGRSVQELNLDGVANADGVKIVGSVPPPLRLGYTLDVEGDELVFRKGSSVLRGNQIVGGIILIKSTLLGLPLPVTILDVAEVPSWSAGAPPVVAYTLVYPEVSALLGVKNVCSGNLLDPLASVATVLGGERYSEATKEVIADQPRWLTIACAGSAAAKLKLLGYGPQSSATTVAQRQATLKMVTADYCGDGHSYTQNGTLVFWENNDGTVAPDAGDPVGGIEAIWDEHGARCLDATRIADAEVDCELPTCAGLGLGDAEWVTHVPAAE